MFPVSKNRELAPALSSTTARHSFTLPARPAVRSASQPASANTSDGIETLFVCSTSKIVSFTPAGPTARSTARDDTKSTEWKSPTERTLAVGVLRIYRVTASNVSFLNSGNLLHTIFPRSQCWCVDGQSVFVLRVRQDSYYRIELQYDTQEDKDRIAHFTSVLAQVLQYERTQCPFTRSFEVAMPARPKTPPRKTIKRQPSQKAKKWLFDKAWVPENGSKTQSRPSTPVLQGPDAGTTASYEEDDRSSIHTDSSEVVAESSEVVLRATPPNPVRKLSIAERASVFQGLRSVTAPIVTKRTVSTVSMARVPELPKEEPRLQEVNKPALERQVSEAASLASSADSFYSLDASTTRNPSPAILDKDAQFMNPWAENTPKKDDTRGRSTRRRMISEVTTRGSSADNVDDPVTPTAPFHPTSATRSHGSPSSAPPTPPLIDDSDDDSIDLSGCDVATPPDALRMKRLTGASQRRAFSPMPQPKNLFVPPKQNISRQFTNALVRKTYELVLGPPAHLVSIMLRIAASISDGFSFSTYRVRRAEKIPCSWESDEDAEWPDEDDFGIPLNNMGERAHRRSTFSGELD